MTTTLFFKELIDRGWELERVKRGSDVREAELLAELLTALTTLSTTPPGEPEPAGWHCHCGWANGLNLAVCGMCGRHPQEGQGVTFYRVVQESVPHPAISRKELLDDLHGAAWAGDAAAAELVDRWIRKLIRP